MHVVGRHFAVLGANDGVVSSASFILGIASSGVGQSEIRLAGTAGLVADTILMAPSMTLLVYTQMLEYLHTWLSRPYVQ